MKVLDQFIENLYTGDPVEFEELRITPVFIRGEGGLPYLELEEALKSGLAEVSEVSEQGSVPDLQVTNKADRDLLILDGEELVGAKQNRIVNTTIVVPARESVRIPVTCVEQGRWRYSSARFSTSSHSSYPSLRVRKHKSVTDSLRSTGSYRSDQSEVWGDIRAKSERMSVESDTMSMSDVYVSSLRNLDEGLLAEKLAPGPKQVGYLAHVRDGFAGCDVFGSPELCRTKLPKLVRGYYLDSLDRGVRFPALTVEGIIRQVRTARTEEFATVGKGAELRFEAEDVQGACKVVDEFIPHLMVFPKLN